MTPEPRHEGEMVMLNRTLNAPVERVFRAWTEPELLRRWWRAGDDYECTVAEVDARPRGRFRVGMTHKQKKIAHIAAGEFREIVPNQRIVIAWNWEGENQPEGFVTILFYDLKNGQTEIALRHEALPDRESRNQHERGWMEALLALEVELERGGFEKARSKRAEGKKGRVFNTESQR